MPPWVERHPKLKQIWTDRWKTMVAHGIDHDELVELGAKSDNQESLNFDRVLNKVHSDVDKLIEDCRLLSSSQP
jgi:hypothetical protein